MSELVANLTPEAVDNAANSTKPKVNTNFNEKNYLNTRLQNGESKKTIRLRILPVSVENPSLYVEIETHKLRVDKQISESTWKNFVCLNSQAIPDKFPKEKCPICEKRFELFKEAKALKGAGKTAQAQTLYDKAKSLGSATTYIMRVIDRDNEKDGVKFWKFNKSYRGTGILDQLLALYDNRKKEMQLEGEENFNLFDLNNGCDIILTISRQFDKEGKELPYNSIKVDAATIRKPLSQDVDQMNAWISDSKKWYDIYSVKPADYISIVLDGKMPRRDDNGNLVGVEINSANAKKEEAAEIAEKGEEILEQDNSATVAQNVADEVKSTVDVTSVNDSGDDELPF